MATQHVLVKEITKKNIILEDWNVVSYKYDFFFSFSTESCFLFWQSSSWTCQQIQIAWLTLFHAFTDVLRPICLVSFNQQVQEIAQTLYSLWISSRLPHKFVSHSLGSFSHTEPFSSDIQHQSSQVQSEKSKINW